MAILQPDGNAGEIILNVSAEGMKGASVTIKTVDRMSAKQQGKRYRDSRQYLERYGWKSDKCTWRRYSLP